MQLGCDLGVPNALLDLYISHKIHMYTREQGIYIHVT